MTTYHFLDLTPASQLYLYTKFCEFDIACSKFAKLLKKDVCAVRLQTLIDAYHATCQQHEIELSLFFIMNFKEFNFEDVPTETQKFSYFRIQAAEIAKDWILTFRGVGMKDVEDIEKKAARHASTFPDEEIAAFFATRQTMPSFSNIFQRLTREAAI